MREERRITFDIRGQEARFEAPPRGSKLVEPFVLKITLEEMEQCLLLDTRFILVTLEGDKLHVAV